MTRRAAPRFVTRDTRRRRAVAPAGHPFQGGLGELPGELLDTPAMFPPAHELQAPAGGESQPEARQAGGEYVRRARFTPARAFITLAQPFQAIAGNPNRSYLIIVNTSAGTVFVNFDAEPSALVSIPIAAGGNYEPIVVPTNAIYIFGSAVGLTLAITEG